MGKLYLSHRPDLLAGHLASELAQDGLGPLALRTIVVPNSFLKQWILLRLAESSPERGIAGCKAITLQEAVDAFLSPSGEVEIYCSIYQELAFTEQPELRSYLDKSPKRAVDMADHLAKLFARYGTFSIPAEAKGWQADLFRNLFVAGPLRLPVQMDPKPHPPLHCFGFDFLPPAIWKLFNFASVYLFSPCQHYWDDLCTDRERARIGRFLRCKGASEAQRRELDGYLTNVPPLLANWGKLGRETVKAFDPLIEEIIEDYTPIPSERNSSLSRLRNRLLDFELHEGGSLPEDGSIQVSKTGGSRLREIESLRESILRLSNEEGIPFSEIAVFAPDIQLYVPLIQLVFSDQPYRIFGLEIGSKSFFLQGLHKLFGVEFEAELLVGLFENPSFSRKKGWDAQTLEKIREWLAEGKDVESALLDRFVFLYPEQKNGIANGDAKVLEPLLETLLSLKTDLASLRCRRTLSGWADVLTRIAETYFSVDLEDEADSAAWGFFQHTVKALSKADREGIEFPFAPIRSLLERPISGGHIRSSHLHAIRFATLGEGQITPVQALFLIGMDEESFPCRSPVSSLDWLKREKIYTADASDRGRYAFLQALFSAREFLHLSYLHLAPDGNPVNPTPLLGELSKSLDAPIRENTVPLPPVEGHPPETILWPKVPAPELPEGEWTVSLSELTLLARHPWEFYLKNRYGLRFEREGEMPFAMLKGGILKAGLQNKDRYDELPLGICGEGLRVELEETEKEWAGILRERGLHLESIAFRKSCKERKKTERGWECPPLRFDVTPALTVNVVGESKFFSSRGYVHSGNTSIAGLLRVWPECLAVGAASGSAEIHFLELKTPKILERPIEAMKAFLKYYFFAQSAPSPLLQNWADPILRKGPAEWERKMDLSEDDAVCKWVSYRAALPSASEWYEGWGAILRESFAELAALYPVRGKDADV